MRFFYSSPPRVELKRKKNNNNRIYMRHKNTRVAHFLLFFPSEKSKVFTRSTVDILSHSLSRARAKYRVLYFILSTRRQRQRANTSIFYTYSTPQTDSIYEFYNIVCKVLPLGEPFPRTLEVFRGFSLLTRIFTQTKLIVTCRNDARSCYKSANRKTIQLYFYY